MVTVGDALKELRNLPFENLEYARLDHHRELRRGFPEVVYAPGKNDDQLKEIIEAFLKRGANTIVTKLTPERFEKIKKRIFRSSNIRTIPKGRPKKKSPADPIRSRSLTGRLDYDPSSRTLTILSRKPIRIEGQVGILTAGTADIPVAKEAEATLRAFGISAVSRFDVGVAGIHRLFSVLPDVSDCDVIIVVAGMDGVLPSIVGGLTGSPLIAVPTSTGYGSSFEGLSALLTMLNSCSPGIAVMNIDNGFGAGFFAALILKRMALRSK